MKRLFLTLTSLAALTFGILGCGGSDGSADAVPSTPPPSVEDDPNYGLKPAPGEKPADEPAKKKK